MATIFDSIAKSHIGNPLKSIWWNFFGKIVNEFQLSTVFAKKPQHRWLDCVACKEKRKKLYYFTYFHVVLYDFMNCPAFVDIKQTLYHKVAIQNKYNQRDVYFLCIVPYVCFAFLRWIKFLVVALDRFFSFGRQEKWMLVALDRWSSYTVTIAWEIAWADSALSISCLRRVVVLQRWLFEQVWL